ncbi:uncharacterized protein LACBIDRAFT_318985 [Laccaria bicolor S238N-H82]|uniref:Predicted protein n=1 Tax=Laccaria bicolor (strain S238N-H82 / ATCC MYA-4686) TaxID=486041 RepID=B0D7L2_LACBS|nr:uncharacterized protein LACBIDRAFT_318985 [Laccaria bicolor S238N-H82]EDR09670.1 predicted protein [Laccaria bicolor S238N-H82]|eukprot:XP_001880019.1 predicted protein [Laccaria bicolor S238N-H82]
MDQAVLTHLDFSVGRLEGLNLESGAIDSPILQLGDIEKVRGKGRNPPKCTHNNQPCHIQVKSLQERVKFAAIDMGPFDVYAMCMPI